MTKRIDYYDIAKGLLIILVIIGHITTYETTFVLRPIIYTFHMPAFFMISGMLSDMEKLYKRSWKEYLIRKIKKLVIPYIIFEAFGAVYQMFLYGTDYMNVKGAVFNAITFRCSNPVDWFLPTIFFADVLFFILCKTRKNILIYLTVFISAILGFGIPCYVDGHISLVFARCCIGYVFVVIGNVFKKIFQYKNSGITILAAVVTIIITITNGRTSLVSCICNNPLLYVLGGFSGTLFIIGISQRIQNSFLRWFGRNSLIVMGTHEQLIIRPILYITQTENFPLIWQPMVFVIVMVLEVILLKMCDCIKQIRHT